ncbi:MAG: hypothetical protein JSW72_07310 [Candidatus Bathyarchaeota archaeon]|nr:MAG: hypothetical protein JSW72_07310 [Candidatus Bathyarchaeota archaeon]
MHKKVFALVSIALMVFGAVSTAYFFQSIQACLLDFETEGRVVDKKPSESFRIEIVLRNKGTIDGMWEVNMALEGDDWLWAGKAKELALKGDEEKTLSWQGKVPSNAPVGSVARLIAYYDNKFVALNWWIRVVSDAEICIVDSRIY